MMEMEMTSIAIIVLITAIVVAHHGTVVDPAQLNVSALPIGGVMSSLAFAVFSYVGFESAATLAKEARNPTRVIPLAVTLSAAVAGGFFVIITYFMVFAVGDEAKVIGDSSSPFAEITTRAGITWAAAIVYAAALISMFACGIASINAASRMMFSMGRYRYLPAGLGTVHETHKTPHLAVTTAALLTLVVCLLLGKFQPVDAFGYTGTFATFGFLVVYLLICVVAPIDLSRAGVMKFGHVLIAIIGVALMGFVIFGSIYPVPDYPYNLLPYMFGGYLLLGAFWYSLLKGNAPKGLAGMHDDMEGEAEG
jgi:amino acid transporter